MRETQKLIGMPLGVVGLGYVLLSDDVDPVEVPASVDPVPLLARPVSFARHDRFKEATATLDGAPRPFVVLVACDEDAVDSL